ncbi:ankyrin repeat domain-containing protein [Wolbachia endosymbiont (group B) of Chesias legatella]|uniref:ankyrin repeat domain-containing protein n=1 Tax=Wolbachia endosymbiont (group B) of Chesias legatella TaxID=3066167 RepID=UPI0031333E3C
MAIAEQEIDSIFKKIESELLEEDDVIEKIKQKLFTHEETYKKWEECNFYRSYLFEIKNTVVRYYSTALNIAAHNGCQKIVEHLVLKQGTAINRRDAGGYTSLHCAASNGHIRIVKLLLEMGASINCKANMGGTPLHFATANDHLGVVKALLNRGACTLIKDKNNHIPRFYAKSIEVFDTLKKVETKTYEEFAKREKDRKEAYARKIIIVCVASSLLIAAIGYTFVLSALAVAVICASIVLISSYTAYKVSHANTKMEDCILEINRSKTVYEL